MKIFTSIDKELPKKGKDVAVRIKNQESLEFVFRCDCYNKNCEEWRCSFTGLALMLSNVESWRYVEKHK